GLALRTARRRLSLAPLALSVCNRYRPSVDEFLEHAAEVRERSGWDDSFVRRRVERVRAVDGGFELDGRDQFAHVLLALGHPGRAWDEPLRTRRFSVSPEPNGAEQVICATGFRHGFAHDELLHRLAGEHGLETADRWLVLAADSTVPALTDETRTLALAGVHA